MKQIFKYIGIFLLTLLTLIILQYLAISIPNKYIEKNMIESVEYYDGSENYKLLFEKKLNKNFNSSIITDYYGECLTLNLLWNTRTSESSILKSQTSMLYYENTGSMSQMLRETVIEGKTPNEDYSRYWNGPIAYLKPLLVFFNIKEIKIINCIILLVLTIYLLKCILKKSKILFISFLAGLISINYFMVGICFEYYFVFLIMLISSIITMKTLKKDDKYFYYLMIVSGITACFFDLLTCETVTLTIPILIKLYFEKNKTTKEKILFFIKSCLLWAISYGMTFIIKWLITIIVFGPGIISKVWNKAKIRIYDIPVANYELNIFQILLLTFNLLFPFSLAQQNNLFLLIFILFTIWFYIFSITKKRQRKYNILLLICIIPIARLTILFSHTAGHYFFDYRALLPLVIVCTLIFTTGIKTELRKRKKFTNKEKSSIMKT